MRLRFDDRFNHKYLFLLKNMNNPRIDKTAADTREPVQVAAHNGRREIESVQLFGGSKELLIRHDGECYTLRRTSKGKLILTK